jgi:signal transduction histidine kinase
VHTERAESLGSLPEPFAQSPQPLLAVDGSGEIRAVNAAAEAEFGQSASDLVGQSVGTLVPEGAHAHHRSRLEALGQLAGGLAHDLNNLLTVIMNYSRFVAGELDDPALRADVEEIDRASQQAADLVHRLLVFARQEVVHPQALDLNEVVASLAGPLRRTLGGAITLDLDLGDDLDRVLLDPGQLEELVVSLALNARDALPEGGRVVLRTGREGDRVWLAVEDDGVGMAPDVAGRAFEPFFTTKPPGGGSGLGLATVYGVVTGAGGRIDLRSEVDEGTTVRIDLPTTDAPVDPSPRGARRPLARGRETILLADDEAAVRETARRILADAGYEVLTAASGEEALEVADTFDGPIHLVVTDLVMPHVGGSELARRVVGVRPGVGVLFMSGYSKELFEGPGSGGPDIPLIEKPFDGPTLLERVRTVIDEAEERRDG